MKCMEDKLFLNILSLFLIYLKRKSAKNFALLNVIQNWKDSEKQLLLSRQTLHLGSRCHILPRECKQLEMQGYPGLPCELLAVHAHGSTDSVHCDKSAGGGRGQAGSSMNFHSTHDT